LKQLLSYKVLRRQGVFLEVPEQKSNEICSHCLKERETKLTLDRFKRGGFIHYDETPTIGTAVNKRTGKEVEFERPIGWSVMPDVPKFTAQEGRSWLFSLIPKLPDLSYQEEEKEL